MARTYYPQPASAPRNSHYYPYSNSSAYYSNRTYSQPPPTPRQPHYSPYSNSNAYAANNSPWRCDYYNHPQNTTYEVTVRSKGSRCGQTECVLYDVNVTDMRDAWGRMRAVRVIPQPQPVYRRHGVYSRESEIYSDARGERKGEGRWEHGRHSGTHEGRGEERSRGKKKVRWGTVDVYHY